MRVAEEGTAISSFGPRRGELPGGGKVSGMDSSSKGSTARRRGAACNGRFFAVDGRAAGGALND